MTRTVLAALLLAPLTALASPPTDVGVADLGPVAADLPEPAPIVNGELEPGWEQTVALGAANFSACTGSVIAPRVVLTAGHCGADFPVELLVQFGQAIFGPNVNEATHRIGFVDFSLHPDYVPLGTAGMSQTLPEFDIALLELAEDAPVEPIPIRTRPFKNKDVGKEVVSVGFGITSSAGAGSGVKRSATLVVDEFDEMFVLSDVATNDNGANICSGDSGGPQYYKNPETGAWEQWAVHSWGDQNCLFNSGSTRTDVAADFILDFVERVHGTTDYCEMLDRYGDGTCDRTCDKIDPDCVLTDPATLADADVKGCDTAPALGWSWLLLLPMLGWRRR